MEKVILLLPKEEKLKIRNALFNEYYKQYRKEHREQINKNNGKPVICKYCNTEIKKWNTQKHQKTKTCMEIRKLFEDTKTREQNELIDDTISNECVTSSDESK